MDTLDDLKAAVRQHWEDGKKIISHFKRMEQEYSDWEDRLVAIEKKIEAAEKTSGISKEELSVKPSKAPVGPVDFDIDDLL